MVPDKKIFSCFLYISLCQICDPGVGLFWPQGHNLNKIGRGPRGDATLPHIKALSLMVSDEKIFSCFSIYKPM